MQTLFDLVQSLSREEKRLYQLHKREGRTQHIYEAYNKATDFEKGLDQAVYAEHFADVSRAFYSMQKRALMDDILTVLLEYSNNADPRYQYARLYGRARVLLERRIGEAAVQYSEEARERAQQAATPEAAIGAVRIQQAALVLSKQPSLKAYEELTQLEARMAEQGRLHQLLDHAQNRLTLLRLNVDGEDETAIRTKAAQFMTDVQSVSLDGVDPITAAELEMGRLACAEIYHELLGTPEDYHRKLTAFVKTHVGEASPLPLHDQYKLLNRHLKSGLAVGDFLMLTGAVYRLNKEALTLPQDVQKDFLPTYFETSALFYFYENDIPAALAQLDAALSLDHLLPSQHTRITLYRLAILLAAHLPEKGLEYLKQASKGATNGTLSLMGLLEVLFLLDLDKSGEEASFAAERHRNLLRKRGSEKHLLDVLNTVLQFIDRGKLRAKPLSVFPSDWEDILRVDLWLKAKANGSFYYNLLTERWQARRQVF